MGEINRAKECSAHCVHHAWDKPNGEFVYPSLSKTEEHHWHLTKRILEQLKIDPVQNSANKNNLLLMVGKQNPRNYIPSGILAVISG